MRNYAKKPTQPKVESSTVRSAGVIKSKQPTRKLRNKKHKTVRRARANRSTGDIRPTRSTRFDQPIEFRMVATSDGPLCQMRVQVTANLPNLHGYIFVDTAIRFFTWEGDRMGIYAVRNPDAWLAVAQLNDNLFTLFSEAIANGYTITRELIEGVIAVDELLIDHQGDLSRWITIVKQLVVTKSITKAEGKARLRRLDALINSLDARGFICYPAALL